MSTDLLNLLGYGFLAAILIAIVVTVLLVNSVSLPFLGAALLIAVVVILVYWLARHEERSRRLD